MGTEKEVIQKCFSWNITSRKEKTYEIFSFSLQDVLTIDTILNCFQKAGISTKSQETTMGKADNPFKELQD